MAAVYSIEKSRNKAWLKFYFIEKVKLGLRINPLKRPK